MPRNQEVLGKFQVVVFQMLKSEYIHLAGIKSLVSIAEHVALPAGICMSDPLN